MKRLILFLILLPEIILCQGTPKQQKLDSLYKALALDSAYIYRFRKARPYINYHERHSFNNPIRTNFYGPQIGIVLYEKHIIGTGIYFSGKGTRQPYEVVESGKTVTKRINVNYYTLFYQYILYNHRYFEFHIPVEAGLGNFYHAYIDSSGGNYNITNTLFSETCAGIHGILKPFRWIGISGTVGYRLASDENFTGFFYSFGVWLGLRHLKNDIMYHLVKKKRYRRAADAVNNS
jgi:hypothetical protein